MSDIASSSQSTAAPRALYDAFVSYSHAKDKPVAAALQSVMQRLGKPWHKRRALRIFRDDTSLAATPELWPSIEQALSRSRYLIVLASQEAASSVWVAKEVAYWLEHKSEESLLIGLTAGELVWRRGDFVWSETTPLPAVLKARFLNEPKWIDLRAHRDAPDARDARLIDAAADLAAAVRGIPKEDLLSQEMQQQRRALALAWSTAAILLALTAAAGWQWFEAEQAKRAAVAAEQIATEQKVAAQKAEAQAVAERDRAERNLALARKAAEELVFKIAQGLRDVQGMRVETIRQILETAQTVMDELVRSAPDDPQLQRSRAAMLNEFALIYLTAGDFERARRVAEESLAIMRRLVAASASTTAQRDVSVVLDRLGDVLVGAGDTKAALAAYEEGLAIARALAVAEPGNAGFQRDIYVSLEKVGDARVALGDHDGGLAAFEEGLALIRKLTEGHPQERAWRRDLSVVLNKVGDIRRAKGSHAEALALYEESLRIVRELLAAQPENLRLQRDLSISLERIGDMRVADGDRAGALAAYEEGLAVVRKLVAADPGNIPLQTSLVIMLHRISTVADPVRAREALREAVALIEALERAGKLMARQRDWPKLLREALSKLPPATAGAQ